MNELDDWEVAILIAGLRLLQRHLDRDDLDAWIWSILTDGHRLATPAKEIVKAADELVDLLQDGKLVVLP